MCQRDDFPPYQKAVAYTNVTNDDWVMADSVPFRTLDAAEERRFRQWARDNYKPGEPVNPLWHPVVQSECARMEREEFGS